MQYSTLALGTAIILFGFYTALMSIKSPDELIRLKYMKAKLGIKAGTIIHILAYVMVPIVFGFFIVRAGVDGITISQFITNAPSQGD